MKTTSKHRQQISIFIIWIVTAITVFAFIKGYSDGRKDSKSFMDINRICSLKSF